MKTGKTEKASNAEQIVVQVVLMRKRVRRIVREFSEKTGIPIVFENDVVFAERSQRGISLTELEHALSHIRAEFLEDSLPILLFHLDEKAVFEQAKDYLLGRRDKIVEKIVLTYKIRPSTEKTRMKNKEFLPLRYTVGKFEWRLGLQCGNSIGEKLLIQGHSFIPLGETETNVSEKQLVALYEEGVNKWPIEGVAGSLDEASNLFYLSGNRISDFLFDQGFVERIQSAIRMLHEELVFFPISRHFALFTTRIDNATISEVTKKSIEISKLAARDYSVAEVVGVDFNFGSEKPIGSLGQGIFPKDRVSLRVSPVARIKWDVTGGDALVAQ